MAKKRKFRRRLILLLVIGLIAIAGVLAYRHFWFYRPIGEGPTGPPVDHTLFADTWTDRRIVLLGVGDSITAGLGARTAEHSYFNRLVRNPDDEFPEMNGLCLSVVLPNLETNNLAVSGTTSLADLKVLAERLDSHEPDILGFVVMTTGGNDLIHNYGRTPPREGAMYGATIEQAKPWISNFQKRLNKMLDILDLRFPGGCHVFLADIYDPTDGVGDAPSVYLPAWPDGLAIHAEYNAVIHACAEQSANVHLVSLHQEFLGHGSHCRQFWRKTYRHEDPHYWYFDNIEDPNDRGYDAIRRLFLNKIVNVAKNLAEFDGQ
ncbi:MAG: SGNH/GDSL hydrolase family protein [Pirellulaceae bacterium]|nr:SGNH/GDSL hydrolase family protein [Pirellulaceae bacterium]